MALFKIKKGVKANLPTSYVEGYCYFTTDDGKFYIDTSNEASGRICLNARQADKAVQDASGNVITNTYATKIELNDAGFLSVDLNSADSGTEPYINADMLGGILASQYALKSDIITEGVSSVTSINGKIGDVSLTYSDVGAAAINHTHDYVPTSRTINNKALSGNISLTYSDVGAAAANHTHGYVPTSRTINGKALSSDISLTYSDVGAAAASHSHSYIPLSGSSSITGNLEFSNSSTALRGIIGTIGDNDFWRVVGGATASNGGYLEIATADDASEPIYVRQYGSGKFGTLTRTATLLDGSGNTSFPGTVSSKGANVYTTSTLKFSLSGTTLTITTS